MTTAARSETFQRFARSVAGKDPDSRESVDVEALLALDKDERHAAEEMLIQRIAVDDWRAPPALATAECRGAVMPMKRALAGDANGRMKVAIALALKKLEAIDQADPIVADVLREGDPDSGLAALVAAEEMKSPDIRDALAWACLHHPSRTVRVNAGATLFYMAGLAPDPMAFDYRVIYIDLGEEDMAVRRKAFEQICEIVGMPPELAG
jgi:HEAT repeat protein